MTDLSPSPKSTQSLLSRPLMATMNINWEQALYILFILIAILTRFWALGDRVMSHDESLHTQFSYQFYDGQGFSHTPLMHGPLLFHITAVSYWLFGDSDMTARLPIALLGIIIVILPYFLRRWLGREGALVTSFIFLISPFLNYYARYIRHDTPVILWAMIIFITMLYYFRERKDKYLYWFSAAMALMFATKEVSFIYVAIFGSFTVMRLLATLKSADWVKKAMPAIKTPGMVVGLGILLIAVGGIGYKVIDQQLTIAATTEEATEPFAADPDAATAVTEEAAETPETPLNRAMRWTMIIGIGILSAGLFLAAKAWQPQLNQYAEFDFIILFTSVVLPMVSPLLVSILGWNPRDYSITSCVVEGQETMSAFTLFLGKLGNATCVSSFFESGMVRSGGFLLITLVVGVLLGLWWNWQKWVVFAAIFHTIFFVLYTSVFTNLPGWTSGMIGSLGYWLEQQSVARGNQPEFYYFIIVPFYEFLSLIFSLAAIKLWLKKQQVSNVVGYWFTLLIITLFGFSLTDWFFNRINDPLITEPNRFAGMITAVLILGIGTLLWFFWLRPSSSDKQNVPQLSSFFGFVPFLIWWMALTWVAYTVAGEKMPWLTTHFVIPMALLAGWYFNEKIQDAGGIQEIITKPALSLLGVTIGLIVAAAIGLGPLLLGQVQFGNQELGNLGNIGRFLGGLVAAGITFYFWQKVREQVSPTVSNAILSIAAFAVLSVLTIRFTYMANFINGDYATEFMVYAHGAPAAKSVVLDQVEELSMRLNGDKTMKVAFGGSGVAWPFTWYLRDYPNRNYFAESATAALIEYPVVIVGRSQADNVDRILRNTHEYTTHTYLWWPMEEYRQISWNAILGDANVPPESRRGLGNPAVRQALWDIFFYRNYDTYSQVFGSSLTTGQWPLRDDLRLYIRKDVLANLWDYGVGAVNATGLVDPYAEGELFLTPSMVINESGLPSAAEGELAAPRNVAIAPNGRLFIADSGNHRIQVFEADGTFVTAWGTFGAEPGQFNEPWGIAADENFVYVADTWNHRIQKFTHAGQLAGVFGGSGSPADAPDDNGLGLFFGPRSIILHGNNQLLVTDTGNHRIQLLDRDGNFMGQVGGEGGVLGQMFEPVGLAADQSGNIMLADTWNGRIQQFTSDLFAYKEWQVNAWSGNSINNKPYVATDRDSRLYVTDPEGYRVLIFNSDGNYLGRFGTFGADSGSFGLPNGIAIDGEDNIYIADSGNNRILKFDPIFPAPPETAVEEPNEEGDLSEEEVPVEEIEESSSDSDEAANDSDVESNQNPTPTNPPDDGGF